MRKKNAKEIYIFNCSMEENVKKKCSDGRLISM